jgi:hypothetical protein
MKLMFTSQTGKISGERETMILQDVIDDIHALYEDLKVYERKYGILSETFYELYVNGTEPDNEDWVLDWSDWAGAYKLLIRRQEQYRHTLQILKEQPSSLTGLIIKTSGHEPVQIAS